jgi:hypothetical protein
MNIKRIRRVAFWSVVVLLVATLVVVFLPVSPHGRFSTPSIGNAGDAYFEASEGQFSQVTFDGRRGREGRELRQFIGDYHKEHGRWVLNMPDGSTGELRATLLSLHIIDPRTRPAGPYYRYEINKGR